MLTLAALGGVAVGVVLGTICADEVRAAGRKLRNAVRSWKD